MKTLLAATATLCLGVPGLTQAQSVEQIAQATINAHGKDCPRVTVVKPFARTDSGTLLLAAACSNGAQHVLKVLPNNTLEYVSTCGIFEAVSKIKCFSS